MSSLRTTFIAGLLGALVISSGASAGLYGFDEAHPYTVEEQILEMEVPPKTILNYRDKMRDNVISLSEYAKSRRPDFQIIAHEGQDLLNKSLWEYHLEGYNQARLKGIDTSDPSFLLNLKQQSPEFEPVIGGRAARYIHSLDGIAVNNHYCQNTPVSPTVEENGLPLISIDYCPTGVDFDNAVIDSVKEKSRLYAFIKPNQSFSKIRKQPIISENADNVFTTKEARNISFLLNDKIYTDKNALIEAVRDSNYDIVVIEPYFHQTEPYTIEEINSLKYKKNGAKRLIIARFSVSEAKDNAFYWKPNWKIGHPGWLKRASFVEPNAAITEYWNRNWLDINSRFFKGIVDTGFDGAFLTGIENHRYFEKLTPLE